jgi:hypothetical protein
MQEADMSALSAPGLRCAEAQYFLSRFIENCGPPVDSYFLMVCYFDAFLFSLISVEEMISSEAKEHLRRKDVFRFLKALRNISSHHSVLGASLKDSKFPRPFSRTINVSVGGPPDDSSRLRLRFDVLRNIFDSIEQERPQESKNLDIARKYLAKLEKDNNSDVFIEDIMKEGLNEVKLVI